ncbi:OmpL47-type beta-barrel domain-containing protein [Agromyces subbeticus]|uniref:OmpL47-type beta-barrel domain-containing protein n=1 Tax=Agromyces subbeticus TaxID=293890 RepID=UPI0012EBFE41|nr:hypothetical protein [Agromyces subbeticus]
MGTHRPHTRTHRRRSALAAIVPAAVLASALCFAASPALASESDSPDVSVDVRIAPIDVEAPTLQIVFDANAPEAPGNGNGKPKGDGEQSPGKSNGKHDEYKAKGEVLVTVLAADDASGVASIEYSLDGGVWQAYAAPFGVTAHGKHTIAARASDVAGNTSDTASRNFKITGKPIR